MDSSCNSGRWEAGLCFGQPLAHEGEGNDRKGKSLAGGERSVEASGILCFVNQDALEVTGPDDLGKQLLLCSWSQSVP